MARVTAILLAAGLSTRMGTENKLFLPVNEKPMIQQTLEKIAGSHAVGIVAVCNEASVDFLKQFASEKVKVVLNTAYQSGMTSSIQAGIRNAPPSDGYMICLGDQPFIHSETYNQLLNAFEAAFQENTESIILPFYQGQKGNPVIFSDRYREAILAHGEPDGCKEIVMKNKEHLVKVDVATASILKDIDTPEDYRMFR